MVLWEALWLKKHSSITSGTGRCSKPLPNQMSDVLIRRVDRTWKMEHTGCSLNIVFFPSNVVIFLNSASSAAALVFYLPGVCTHRGKTEFGIF